jgi:hypothetical protein
MKGISIMFDNLDEELDKKNSRKLLESTLPHVDTPSNLYTKKFTKSEWEKLDVVLEIGNSKTIQDLLNEKYNIEIIEGTLDKNSITKFKYRQLEALFKTVLKTDKENFKNAIKLRSKFLLYAQRDHEHLVKWINGICFIENVKGIPEFKKTNSAV